jgi:hypothetical protein
MTDLLEFIEKCTVNGEPFKLKPYQRRLWKMIKETKIKLKPRSRGASQLGHSTISVMTAGAEDPPCLGHDAFMTSQIVEFQDCVIRKGDYTIGIDHGALEGDFPGVMVGTIKDHKLYVLAFENLSQVLWVDRPHFWPRDMFEWHENETWWLAYCREHGIDVTRYVPMGGKE